MLQTFQSGLGAPIEMNNFEEARESIEQKWKFCHRNLMNHKYGPQRSNDFFIAVSKYLGGGRIQEPRGVALEISDKEIRAASANSDEAVHLRRTEVGVRNCGFWINAHGFRGGFRGGFEDGDFYLRFHKSRGNTAVGTVSCSSTKNCRSSVTASNLGSHPDFEALQIPTFSTFTSNFCGYWKCVN